MYIVPLQEEWNLPPQVAGKANPKSSIGRVDVFTRLITDYSSEFERVAPGYKGKLYVEIVPRTFSILVQAGTRMNQLRFIRGVQTPSDARLVELHEEKTLVYIEGNIGPANISAGLWVSVDLEGDADGEVVAYRAKHHAPLLDLDRADYYDPADFWDPIVSPRKKQLILNPEDLYILASKEWVRVPPSSPPRWWATTHRSASSGSHYAGFSRPGFGYGADDVKGARAVLEVRSHEVPFLLEDGQPGPTGVRAAHGPTPQGLRRRDRVELPAAGTVPEQALQEVRALWLSTRQAGEQTATPRAPSESATAS